MLKIKGRRKNPCMRERKRKLVAVQRCIQVGLDGLQYTVFLVVFSSQTSLIKVADKTEQLQHMDSNTARVRLHTHTQPSKAGSNSLILLDVRDMAFLLPVSEFSFMLRSTLFLYLVFLNLPSFRVGTKGTGKTGRKILL